MGTNSKMPSEIEIFESTVVTGLDPKRACVTCSRPSVCGIKQGVLDTLQKWWPQIYQPYLSNEFPRPDSRTMFVALGNICREYNCKE